MFLICFTSLLTQACLRASETDQVFGLFWERVLCLFFFQDSLFKTQSALSFVGCRSYTWL